LILVPIAEDGHVGVEEEQGCEADAAARVLDDRGPVEHVQLLEDAQLTSVVTQAGLEIELGVIIVLRQSVLLFTFVKFILYRDEVLIEIQCS